LLKMLFLVNQQQCILTKKLQKTSRKYVITHEVCTNSLTITLDKQCVANISVTMCSIKRFF
jgi:hypothetical protein